MMIRRYRLPGLLWLALAGHGVYAAELNIEIRQDLTGTLGDGIQLAAGRLSCQKSHSGFRVWMGTGADREGQYILTGKQDPRHVLRVRLSGDGWRRDGSDMPGLVRAGAEEQAAFAIVADGQQTIRADEYRFSVSGTCF